MANAQERTRTTLVAHLSAENEVPECPDGEESGARGVAIIRIDAATGEIRYLLVATKLPVLWPRDGHQSGPRRCDSRQS